MAVDSSSVIISALERHGEIYNECKAVNIILNFWIKLISTTPKDELHFERYKENAKRAFLVAQVIVFEKLSDNSKKNVKAQLDLFFSQVDFDTKLIIEEQKLKKIIEIKENIITNITSTMSNMSKGFDSMQNIPRVFEGMENNLGVKLDDLKEIDPEKINILMLYSKYKEEYFKWLELEFKSKRSNCSKVRHKTKSKYIFEELKLSTASDFLTYFRRLDKSKDDRTNITFRNFIKFCEDNGYLKRKEGLVINNMIPGGLKNKSIDKKRASEDEILEFLGNVKEFIANPPSHIRKEINELYLLFTKLSIESGARITSIKFDMLENFDKNRLKQFGEVSIYEFKKDATNENDNKLALFLFCRTKTINSILEYYENGKITPKFYKYFEDNIIEWLRNEGKSVVLFKYHRKFLKSLLSKQSVVREYAEYISSRKSNLGVGDISYDDLVKFSIREYEKVLPDLNRILDN